MGFSPHSSGLLDGAAGVLDAASIPEIHLSLCLSYSASFKMGLQIGLC